MADEQRGERETGRRATLRAGATDTRTTTQLLEPLIVQLLRDASLVGSRRGGGAMLASAGEAAEFGLGDLDRAREIYARSAGHEDADARAFAGLRRLAREADDAEGLVAWYRAEAQLAATPEAAVLAGAGLAQSLLRGRGATDEIEQILRDIEPLVDRCPADVAAFYQATLEDVLVSAKKGPAALRVRARRWAELRTSGKASDTDIEHGALALAVAASALGAPTRSVEEWYEVVFELRKSITALRPLLRAAYAAADPSAAEALIGEVVEAEDDADVRARYQYEQGMLRAHRLGDRAGGLSAMASAMKGADVGPLIATTYLSQARALQGAVATDEFVDALSISLDFAASGVERADLLTRMASRLDGDLGLTAAAIEYAREALAESPGYQAALRLLGAIYAREARWGDLALLSEQQLALTPPSDERLRQHERLGDLYESELGDFHAAERHYRAVLAVECHLPVVRRLARLLAAQFRWEDLFDHLRDNADRVSLDRERLYLLERAADIAESRLREPGLAVEVYRDVLALQPAHAGAISSIGRLLSELGRWSELLELNEVELALTPDDVRVRVAILCRCAEVARRYLGHAGSAEMYYRRALDEDAICSDALRGLGQILAAQERWAEVVEMTEAEMAQATSDEQRLRCLAQLAELHAVHTGDTDAAIGCFEKLSTRSGAQREHALVWLERLYEATDRPEDRLRVLAERYDDVADASSRARLAFRIAELKEWRLGAPADAFESYVEAMRDPIATPVCVTALDRLWDDAGVSITDRRLALRTALELSNLRRGIARKQLLEFAADRGAGCIDAHELQTVWTSIASEWPGDVRASEHCAVQALQGGDVALAEALRANAPAGPVEAARAHFVALDERVDRGVLDPVDDQAAPTLVATLALEAGEPSGFDGDVERDTFLRIADGHIALGELRRGDGTEVGSRLAILASRTLGDLDSLRAEAVALAAGLEDPTLAMRAWLDLVAEEGFSDDERRGWLREASALRCFDAALRDQLYTRMGDVSDLQALEQALTEHLDMACPEAPQAAQLGLRRARCLDAQGRRADAVASLRTAMEAVSDDAIIAIEKARLETLGDELDEARETLEACLDAGVGGDGRIEVLGRLADLHQMDGGDRRRAIAALEDAYTLSNGAKDWGTRLASAHATFGLPARCAEVLIDVLPVPPALEDLRHWHLLAKVHLTALDEPEAASDILWTLFRAYPDKRATLAALEDFYRRSQNSREFADRMAAILAEGHARIASDLASKLWKYVGEVNHAVLHRPAEAEDAFRRARSLGDQSADVVLRLAKSIANQPGRVRDAVPLLVDALRTDDGDLRLWDEAFQHLELLFDEMQMHGRLRVARQVRATLGASVELFDDQVRRDPTRDIPPGTAWSLLASGLLSERQIEVMVGCAPLAEKVLGKRDPSRRALKGRKLRREENLAFDTFLDNACRWLGVERPKVLVGEGGRGAVAVDAGTYWVPSERIGDNDPARARFWAGYVAGMVFADFAPYTWTDDATIHAFFRAVTARVGRGAGTSPFDDELGSLLLATQRRQAVQAVESHMAVANEPFAWSAAAQRFCDRAALVSCGDVRTAVEELLVVLGWDRRIDNPRTREFVVADGRLRSLLLYAVGDDHFMARYESGLADRPFLFA